MEQVTPHSIRLIASVSRLIDLHQSRRESGVFTPSVPENAGYNLSVALTIIEVLHDMQMSRGAGAVSISELFELSKKRIPCLLREELNFCIETIKTKRDIHYAEHFANGDYKEQVTFNTTALVKVIDGYDQIELTENAQLLLRIGALKDEWLFNDVEAEKLVKAIEREQFDRIHDFCLGLVADIARQNGELVKLLEIPSANSLRSKLIVDGSRIEESLLLAKDNVNSAITLFSTDGTIDSFNLWKEREHIKYGWNNVLSEIESVLQCIESYSRNFVKFLDSIQQVRSASVQRIDFLRAIEYVSTGKLAQPEKTLNVLLSHLLPFGFEIDIFHPAQMVGQVDFNTTDNPVDAQSVFVINKAGTTPSERLHDFISRNREALLTKLKASPLRFSELINVDGFKLGEGESLSDFFGVYLIPEEIQGSDNLKVVVGLTHEMFSMETGGVIISGSDPVLILGD